MARHLSGWTAEHADPREPGDVVIKLERPGSDSSRHWDLNAVGEGAQFSRLNRRTGGVVLGLRYRERADSLELLGRADLLVRSLSPGALSRLGLDGADARDGRERPPSLWEDTATRLSALKAGTPRRRGGSDRG